MNANDLFTTAFETRDIERFLNLLMPPAWAGIAARILESGAEFQNEVGQWAPRWTRIPPTIRKGETPFETAVKSCMFRVHDCLHQLWGLPIPGEGFTEEDRYLFKRAGMCGEVATLVIEEFAFGSYLYETYPETRDLIWRRNALPMWREGPLQGKTLLQVVMRVDGLLHKRLRPQWVRDSREASAFTDDYVPMLDADRRYLDLHWEAMKRAKWIPREAPNSRYGRDLDGLELTIWMVSDFFHLMNTDSKVDNALREFNRQRRETIKLPDYWDG
jgi:hypothetical protein